VTEHNIDARISKSARRLTRCYPRQWRERYGDEFKAMLTEQLGDEPVSRHRTADVLQSALKTRFEYAGLAGDVLDPMNAG